MKKLSCLMAFAFVILFSSSALAANWVEVDRTDDQGIIFSVYVDKDSIKRGIESKQFKMSRKDGFSTNVKVEVKTSPDDESVSLINYVGFAEKNGKRFYYFMDTLDANGNVIPEDSKNPEVVEADVDKNGTIWISVWDFVTDNLK